MTSAANGQTYVMKAAFVPSANVRSNVGKGRGLTFKTTSRSACWSLWSTEKTVPVALAVVIVALTAGTASAHDGTGLAGGFISGFLHPLNGPDHMLAMVAVGLWGAILGRPLVIALPVVFPLMMAVGGVLGILGFPMPPVELGIGLSVLVLGSAIAFSWKPADWIAIVLVAVFALFHGFAHGQELPSAADPTGYSLGFVASTGLLHIVGIIIGYGALRFGGLAVLRVLGGLIAAAGLWFLFRAVA